MAPRLAVRVGRIVLVEASGTRIKPAHHRSFFEAEQIDDPRHAPTELYRRRMPGGTTSVWGGRCIPFADDKQFAPTRPRPTWRPVASRASSGLLRSSGHVLGQQPEGRGAGLSADLHRHLHQGGLRQALRSQDAESAAHLLNDRVLQRIRFRCYSAAVNSAGS